MVKAVFFPVTGSPRVVDVRDNNSISELMGSRFTNTAYPYHIENTTVTLQLAFTGGEQVCKHYEH